MADAAERWFAARGWQIFDFQREAWAAYRAGESGLIHAPTGTGKSLAAWFGPLLERLEVRPDHTLYWPAADTLILADPHFGKAVVFRRQSLAVPAGTTRDDLARLTDAIEQTGCRRLLILGDFLHAPPAGDRLFAVGPDEIAEIAA